MGIKIVLQVLISSPMQRRKGLRENIFLSRDITWNKDWFHRCVASAVTQALLRREPHVGL